MIRLRIGLLLVCLALAGCSDAEMAGLSASPQATRDPVQMRADGMMAQYAVESGQATLSAVSSRLTETAVAAQATESARVQAITATQAERAYQSSQATASAIGTATQQAWVADQQRLSDQATATAVANATLQTAQLAWTQSAVDRLATADVAAIQSVATQQAIVAESSQLSLERERTMNQVRAVAPWIGIVLAACLLAWLAIRFGRKELNRPSQVQRDERGFLPLLVDRNGATYNDAKNPRPVYQALLASGPAIPQLVDAQAQSTQTRAANTLELVHGGLAGRAKPQVPEEYMPNWAQQNPGGGLVQVVSSPAGGSVEGWLSDVLPAIYSDAIDGEIIDPQKGGSK